MRKRIGLTLSETVVSAAIIAIMIAVAIPVVQVLQESMHSSGARSMISGALAAARALAAKHQKYAGIRFQYDPNGHNQYMIFILHDPSISASGFRAIEGLKPIKLPENLGVMDLRLTRGDEKRTPSDDPINSDLQLAPPNDENALKDTTTFSIIFSPSGKLLIQEVRVIRTSTTDRIFNDLNTTDAMFQEDSYLDIPLRQEWSRNSFVIYNKKEFSKIDEDSRWTDYLMHLDVLYINPYTGTIIE